MGFASSNSAQIPTDWRPRTGRPLTEEEQKWLTMTPLVKTFDKAKLKSKYEFRTMRSERKNLNDNSVIKEWYEDEDAGDKSMAFGRIEEMFVHQAYPGGPQLHFVKARWMQVLPEKGPTGLVQVKEAPDHNFNVNSCITCLEQIVPYNLALLPAHLEDPDCQVFSVVDPETRLGDYL